MKAYVRTILGDDPNTREQDNDAEIRIDVDSATCVVVAGMGHMLYSAASGKAMFTQGPGKERWLSDEDIRTADNGDVELTVMKNGRGQRRMVVVLREDV